MYVVAYLRSPEVDEARRKAAFEGQRFEIEDYCQLKGHSISRFIESTNAAPYIDCPHLHEALNTSDEAVVVAYPSVVTEHVNGALAVSELLQRNKKKLLIVWEDSVIDPADAKSKSFRAVWMNENLEASATAGR